MLYRSCTYPEVFNFYSRFSSSRDLLKDFFDFDKKHITNTAITSRFWEKFGPWNIPSLKKLLKLRQDENIRFSRVKRTHSLDVFVKRMSKQKTVRYLELKEGVNLDIWRYYHNTKVDLFIDFPTSNDYFRFVSYFPVLSIRLKLILIKFHITLI